MKEHPTETKYWTGQSLHSTEIGERPRFFERVIFPEWQKDAITCQGLLFESGTIWQKVKVEPQPLTPEEQHLARVNQIKGIVRELRILDTSKLAIDYYLEK